MWGRSSVALLCALLSGPVLAADAGDWRALDRSHWLAAWVGFHDLIRGPAHSGAGGIEYRVGWRRYGIRPAAGAFATTRGATYVYGGLRWEIRARKFPFVYAMGTAAGYWDQRQDLPLGLPLEFRSGFEFYWATSRDLRVGLAFHHLSNASLGDHNPGTEILSLMIEGLLPQWH